MSVPAEKKEDKLPGFESLEELLDCINAEAPEMVERGADFAFCIVYFT